MARRQWFIAPGTRRTHLVADDQRPACGRPWPLGGQRVTQRGPHPCADCLAVLTGAATRESVCRERERELVRRDLVRAHLCGDVEDVAACERWLTKHPSIVIRESRAGCVNPELDKVLRHWVQRTEHVDANEQEAARHRLAVLLSTYVVPGINDTGADVARLADGQRWLTNPGAWMGERYQEMRRETLTRIAARIRADIKLARKLGKRTAPKPGEVATIDPLGDAPAQIKISVRTEYFSGGGAIRVKISSIPAEWGWNESTDQYGQSIKEATPACAAFYAAVQGAHGAYNYDNSDSMVDHFDRNYWGSVDTDEHIRFPRW
jgi:hypothetical protein